MSRRVVVLMLPQVSGDLRIHNPAERHKPEREPYNGTLTNPAVHRPFIEEPLLLSAPVSEFLQRHR